MNDTELQGLIRASRPAAGWARSEEGTETWRRVANASAAARHPANRRTSRVMVAAASIVALIGAGAAVTQFLGFFEEPAPQHAGYAYDVTDLPTVMEQTSHVFVGHVMAVETTDEATASTRYSVRVERIVIGGDVGDSVTIESTGYVSRSGPKPVEGEAPLQPGETYIFAANRGDDGGYIAAPGPFGAHPVAGPTDEQNLADRYASAEPSDESTG